MTPAWHHLSLKELSWPSLTERISGKKVLGLWYGVENGYFAALLCPYATFPGTNNPYLTWNSHIVPLEIVTPSWAQSGK